MRREDVQILLTRASAAKYVAAVHPSDLRELCDFYLANAPKPKIKPEDQPGVPVRIEDAEMDADGVSGVYLYGYPDDKQRSWTPRYFNGDTHVVYIEVPL